MRCLYRTLRSEGCEVVLCQEYEEGRFDLVVLLGRLLRMPVMAIYQGGDRTRTPGERLIRRRSLRAATGLIIGARRELERVVSAYHLPYERIHMIGNPVDIPPAVTPQARRRARLELGLDPALPVVVWYGRIDVYAKGLDVLVDAWRMCCDERSDRAMQLLLVGDGPGAADLRHRISSGRLRGVRWREEYVLDRRVLATHLAAADLFAFPSRQEGFAVAPMEAMAAGLPVVAADAAGVADLIERDAIGIVVPRDDPAAFAAGLGRLIDHPEEGRAMGQRARASVAKRFSVEGIGAQLGRALAPHLAGASSGHG
jgi:starch synthase